METPFRFEFRASTKLLISLLVNSCFTAFVNPPQKILKQSASPLPVVQRKDHHHTKMTEKTVVPK